LDNMGNRTSLMIKKDILKALEGGELKLKHLERRTKTDSRVLLKHLEELEYFKMVVVTKHQRGSKNGQPYRTVKLT